MTPSALLTASGVGALSLPLVDISVEPLALARLSICGATVAAAAVYDLHEHRIPNRLTLPAAAACLTLTIAEGGRLADLAAGLALTACLMLVGLVLPAAFGMGDVKLMLLIVTGLDGHATRALVLGLLLAAVAGATLIICHGRAAGRQALPLAPFLAAGTLLALLP